MNSSKRRTLWILTAALALLALGNAHGRSWTGGSGNWEDTSKWDPTGTPQAGESIVITNAGAYVTLSNQTAWLDTLLLSNSATLFFTNNNEDTTICLRATNVSVYGTITQAVNTATATNAAGEWPVDSQIYIVCSNFTLGAAGKINGNGSGYARSTWTNGYGPGAGMYHSSRPGGGGYGGRGGAASTVAGVPYGSATAPSQPGSSGGGNSSGNFGGNGGGLVRIEASGLVTVNGAITVNGNPGGAGGAGGSGGGIHISCNALAGSGSVTANGGNGGGGDINTGGGGGGRIAVHYDPVSQSTVTPPPTIAFAANPSVTSANTTQPRPGSIYLTDGSFFPTPMSLGGVIANPASTSYTLPSLTVTNDSLLVFPTGTVLQIAGNLLIAGKGGIELPYGSLTVGTNATFGSAASPFGSIIWLATNGVVSVGSNLTVSTGPLSVYGDETNIATIAVGGDMFVTNSGRFNLYCGTTNAVATNYSALVAVTGDVTVAASSWIYPSSHPTNGGSALFTMRNLNLLNGGGFNANALGYASPAAGGNGYGPGGGKRSADAQRGGGGGYGGTGGVAYVQASTSGITNGIPEAPGDPGSAGGTGNLSGNPGGRGGGLVRILSAGTVTIGGSITANGGNGTGGGGGGSGGGIHIRSQATAGAGTLSANGGNAGTSDAGNGGGGRIALTDWASDGFGDTITVNPGTGGRVAETGSVRRIKQSGTVDLVVQGRPAVHGASLYPYGVNAIILDTIITNTVNSPADESDGVRYACIGWTLTNTIDPGFFASGSSTQAVFQVTSNLVQTWLWTNEWYLSVTSGPNGYVETTPDGWYTNGLTVPISAMASNDYYFVQWTGVGAPTSATSSSVTLTMDRVRTLQANFATVTPTGKRWTGTGNWASSTNWTPPGIPGVQDTVTLASGTATLSDSVTLGTLRLTNAAILILTNASLTCTGDLVLTNTAKFYVHGGLASGIATNAGTWVDIGGDMTVSPSTWVYPTSHPTNGGSPFFRMRNLNVLSGGGFDANGRGFQNQVGASVPGHGTGAGGAGGYRSGGGGYGGAGGCPVGVTGGLTYGSSNAPVDPGSSAGNHEGGNLGGDGGGLIHITVSRDITLNGTLTANGTNGAGGAGGGSGGGVYLSCRYLSGGGPISANGGEGVNSDAGAGGGGRIAIWASDWSSYTGTVTKIKGAQWYGADGTLVIAKQPSTGTMISIR